MVTVAQHILTLQPRAAPVLSLSDWDCGANQAGIREQLIPREQPWCDIRRIPLSPDSTACVTEWLTFVVAPLCVHPVKTVKQPIDLRLYQSQLLFNHLQLLHAHYTDRENTEDIFNKLRLSCQDVMRLICVTCIKNQKFPSTFCKFWRIQIISVLLAATNRWCCNKKRD